MELIILGSIFIAAVVFTVFFSFWKESDKIAYGALAGVLFLIIGFNLIFTGMDYQTGETVIEQYDYNNGTLINTTSISMPTYTQYSGFGSAALGLINILAGLFLLMISAIKYSDKREND